MHVHCASANYFLTAKCPVTRWWVGVCSAKSRLASSGPPLSGALYLGWSPNYGIPSSNRIPYGLADFFFIYFFSFRHRK